MVLKSSSGYGSDPAGALICVSLEVSMITEINLLVQSDTVSPPCISRLLYFQMSGYQLLVLVIELSPWEQQVCDKFL